MKFLAVKFVYSGVYIFTFCVTLTFAQDFTPLVVSSAPTFRPKTDPKGDCRPLDLSLDFHVKLDFPVTNGKVGTEVVSSVRYSNIVFGEEDGSFVARLMYFVRFSDARSSRVVGTFDSQEMVSLTDLKSPLLRGQSHLFRQLIDLPPGNYIADIALRDLQSGCRGTNTIRFTTPNLDKTLQNKNLPLLNSN